MNSTLFNTPEKPSGQILKWVGNKYNYASEIVKIFPTDYNKYIEPFVGTGAVLATLSPKIAIAGDTLHPLIDFWNILKNKPTEMIDYYRDVINKFNINRELTYNVIKAKYNESPNPYDLLIISRTCYGGVIRFTRDGKISTPIGPHKPIPPDKFKERAYDWSNRVQNVDFNHASYFETMKQAEKDDLIYCDPPYIDSQKILYGAQDFNLNSLFESIENCKKIGAKVALSIDGKKKSGSKHIELQLPKDLFEREIYLDCGSSMLLRFQNNGKVMIGEDVHDRLLLTW